ncbi:MAG: chorismate-binding protein, partial [Actinomycetota bacterium]|nr:chorismate-binding protein [Actinomycetota bacterium]
MLPYALLDIERYPLVLAPSDHTGWFSGTSLVAVDPVSRETDVSVAHAAAALERAFTQEGFCITAALVGYDGTAEVRTYSGALASSGAGWFRHGDAPEIPDDSSADFRSMPKGRAARRAVLGRVEIDMDEATWTARVRAVQDAIRAGDVYVMNLTMRVSGHPRLSPVQAFAKLHQSPGGPMAAFFGSPNSSVVSVSPERFLGITLGFDGHTRRAEVWPIKGTAPRGTDESQDAALASGLAASEKERAEHVMVVDLERNDLGRVCQSGSITVDPLLEVFPTPY